MIRTHIQLTREQVKALKELSVSEGVSISALVRRGVNFLITEEGYREHQEYRRRAACAAGRFRSVFSDLSTEHDLHFGESLAE